MDNTGLKFEYSNVCTACGAARRREHLVFSTDKLEPFCSNIQGCNVKNPNSYASVLSRGNLVAPMLTYKEASDKFYSKRLEEVSPQESEVIRMLQKPTSLRIVSTDLAMHIIGIRNKYGLDTITKAITKIIEEHKEAVESGGIEAETVFVPIPVEVKKVEEPVVEEDEEDDEIGNMTF